jgi:plasmid maintenance system antidote protein VapI
LVIWFPIESSRVGGVDRTVRTPDTEGVVVQSFTEDGTRSIRNVADILNQSKNTVQNIVKGNHMHPNHYTKVQRLLSEDYAPRLELQEHEENTGFFADVLLTDESYFCHKKDF